MHHRIIKASEAKKTIESYLEDVENRSTSIAVLSLEEVNVYINAVKTKKSETENIINTLMQYYNISFKAKCIRRIQNFSYNGYTLTVIYRDWNSNGSYYDPTFSIS